MDDYDRLICEFVQTRDRASSADIAQAAGLAVSTANDRVRRLTASGVIASWKARLAPEKVGASLCAFMLIDMEFEGEAEAVEILAGQPEVMELHHITGAHSYLAKIRVENTDGLQEFITNVLKPLGAVTCSESIISLKAIKESSSVRISPPGEDL